VTEIQILDALKNKYLEERMVTNDLAVTKKPNLRTIMRSDEVVQRFSEVLGDHQANGYIAGVLIAVAGNTELQKCNANSIIGSALRAATMRLSVDPSVGQAYLVPFKGKNKDGSWTNNATLIVGYKGIYQMAIRTGKYRFINLITVYEGETVVEDRMTGLHKLDGNMTSINPIGYILYFKLLSGYEKTFYMSCEECEAHGAKYSKTFANPASLWKKDPHVMYKKTVMRMGLIKWGYLDPSDIMAMSASDDEEPVLAEYTEGGVSVEAEPYSGEVTVEMLGYDNDDIPGDIQDENQEEVQKPKPKGNIRPYDPQTVIDRITERANKYVGKTASKDQRGLLVCTLDICFAGTDAYIKRHETSILLQFISGESSSKKVPDNYVLAILDWLKPTKDSGGQWIPDQMAAKEAQSLLIYARKQNRQKELFENEQ
jgi:recombination protein RecT